MKCINVSHDKTRRFLTSMASASLHFTRISGGGGGGDDGREDGVTIQ